MELGGEQTVLGWLLVRVVWRDIGSTSVDPQRYILCFGVAHYDGLHLHCLCRR